MEHPRRASALRAGDQVPWAVSWTGEGRFSLQPSAIFPAMTELVQVEAPNQGEPAFAALHVSRHRRGMAAQLCHVCGKPTPPGDRYIFPAASGGPVPMTDGTVGYGANIAPLHRRCAEQSLRRCPHLRRIGARFLAIPTEDEGRLIPRTDVVPGMEAIARRMPAGVAVVLSCYRLYGPAFAETVAAFLAGA